jgi:hypothetical protein
VEVNTLIQLTNEGFVDCCRWKWGIIQKGIEWGSNH